MSPVGGAAARRLRGAKGLRLLVVDCSCGQRYEISETARDLGRCPKPGCAKPTRDIPLVP